MMSWFNRVWTNKNADIVLQPTFNDCLSVHVVDRHRGIDTYIYCGCGKENNDYFLLLKTIKSVISVSSSWVERSPKHGIRGNPLRVISVKVSDCANQSSRYTTLNVQ